MSGYPCLIIRKGEPYEAGTRIHVKGREMILGRSSSSFVPDIEFVNSYISRRHCSLRPNEGGQVSLFDLASKHGTTLNGAPILSQVDYVLKDGDEVGLAMGVVIIRFVQSEDLDKTAEISDIQRVEVKAPVVQALPIEIHREKARIIGLWNKDTLIE